MTEYYFDNNEKFSFKSIEIMAVNNSRGVLKFNGGEAQKVLKLNYSVQRSTDVSGRVAS